MLIICIMSHHRMNMILYISLYHTCELCFTMPLQQVPFDWEWWITHVFASVIMASLGEYICSRNELEDIPLYNPNT
jgi:hypothetical protein